MAAFIPVLLSFFLGPGFGQLYNKEYKKGAYLIGVSVLVLLAAGIWFYKALQPHLPPGFLTEDPAAMEQMMKTAVTRVSATEGRTLLMYQGILFAFWLYSVIDAYRGAEKKLARVLDKKNP